MAYLNEHGFKEPIYILPTKNLNTIIPGLKLPEFKWTMSRIVELLGEHKEIQVMNNETQKQTSKMPLKDVI